MKELYKSLGFNENPFSRYSAEEEKEYLSKIYFKPKYFGSIYTDVKGGNSRFIVGSRGSGKTALILRLKEELDKNNVFTILFDEYEDIPESKNEKVFIIRVIESIITDYCVAISQYPRLLKKLNTYEKEKLAFFIENFFKSLSRREYENRVNKVSDYKSKNFFKNIWNKLFNKPINFMISGGVEILSDTISKSFGLPKVDSGDFFKNYLPSIETYNPASKIKLESLDYKSLKGVFNDLCNIVTKSGYENVCIFFDKIDENRRLEGSIEKIALFVKDIVQDTNLLLNNNFSLVFSIWDEVRSELNSNGVRFDKIKPIEVSWMEEDIQQILNKRLLHFSNNQVRSDNIIDDLSDIKRITQLANKSPRDLIHVLSSIYNEQDLADNNSNSLTSPNIRKGMLTFCKNYDFYSLFPTKRGTKGDVIRNINRLLRVGKAVIKTNDFVNTFKVRTQTANSYIKIVQDFGFVERLTEMDGNAPLYGIKDPKIKHLIERGVAEIN
jgi:hypothetical protein